MNPPSPRENFWVMSPFLPREMRDDFRNVYAFCRAADDIADEHPGTPASTRQALTQLAEWHDRLDRCSRGESLTDDAIFGPLAETIQRRELDIDLFHDLLRAFELDQTETSFQTWEDLASYCKLSADPVGRIVLGIAGGPANDHQLAMSDMVCTSLQIVNHIQDVREDVLARGRVYLPAEITGLDRTAWADLASEPESPSAANRVQEALSPLLARVELLVNDSRPLSGSLDPAIARVVYLFHAAAEALLRRIQRQAGRTLWVRPRVGHAERLLLLARAVFAPVGAAA